jgi:hypothetical protein
MEVKKEKIQNVKAAEKAFKTKWNKKRKHGKSFNGIFISSNSALFRSVLFSHFTVLELSEGGEIECTMIECIIERFDIIAKRFEVVGSNFKFS